MTKAEAWVVYTTCGDLEDALHAARARRDCGDELTRRLEKQLADVARQLATVHAEVENAVDRVAALESQLVRGIGRGLPEARRVIDNPEAA